MAQDNFHVDLSFAANADLSTKQFQFVKLVTGSKVDVCTSATVDKVIGVLQNKPTSGQVATVRIFGQTKLVLAGTTAAGDQLGTGASSTAVVYGQPDTTHYIVGTALIAGAAADIGTAFVDCATSTKTA